MAPSPCTCNGAAHSPGAAGPSTRTHRSRNTARCRFADVVLPDAVACLRSRAPQVNEAVAWSFFSGCTNTQNPVASFGSLGHEVLFISFSVFARFPHLVAHVGVSDLRFET